MGGLILFGLVLGLLLLSWVFRWPVISRGILAVLGGYATIVVPFIIGVNLLFPDVLFSPDAAWDLVFLLFLLFMFGIGTAGGFVTATLSRRRPVLHTAALAAFLTAFAAISFLSAPAHEPRWTRLATQAVLVPAVIAGGLLRNGIDSRRSDRTQIVQRNDYE